MTMRKAFTLIELLVVIAIVAVLIGFLLPAIQKVRESANRTKCCSHMRQWNLAMHLHHDTYGKLPYASKSNPRTVWVSRVWPFVEQSALAARYDSSRDMNDQPNTIPLTLDGSYSIRFALYYCPSDRPGAAQMSPDDPWWRAKGNYCLNWGTYQQPMPLGPTGPLAPFGYLDHASRTRPQESRFDDFSDGLSTTMLISEMIVPLNDEDKDHRGDMLNDDDACTVYMANNQPNSVQPDCMVSGYCINRPEANLPCRDCLIQRHKAARSRHSGGVNVGMADGSIRFVRDDVDVPSIWAAMSTMNGGEVIKENAP